MGGADMPTDEKKPSVCNCLNLRRASSALTRIYDDKLSASGLSISQFSIIKHLNYYGPLSVSELASKIRLDRTTLVRSLKPLEANGLIIDVSQKGSRNRQLQLSDKGIAKYKEAEVFWKDAQNYLEEKLGKENLETLVPLLSMIERL